MREFRLRAFLLGLFGLAPRVEERWVEFPENESVVIPMDAFGRAALGAMGNVTERNGVYFKTDPAKPAGAMLPVALDA